MKFKLLRGIHNEDGRTYYPEAVVDSMSDLTTLNVVKGAPRFEQVLEEEAAPVAVAEPPKADSLDGMTVEELRKFAEETEVDLGKARTKDQILSVLRSA